MLGATGVSDSTDDDIRSADRCYLMLLT